MVQVWNGFLLEKSSNYGVCCCLLEAFPPEHGAVAQGGRAASLPRSLREQPGLSPARHPRNTREQLHLMARDSRSIPGHHVMIRCHFRDPRLLSFGRWKLSPKSARCSRGKRRWERMGWERLRDVLEAAQGGPWMFLAFQSPGISVGLLFRVGGTKGHLAALNPGDKML